MNRSSFLKTPSYLLDIFSDMNESVYVINLDYDIIYLNASAEGNVFGRESVLYRNLFDVFPSLTKENSAFIKVIKTQRPVKGSICTFITSRGERKTTLTSTYPLFEDGRIIGAYEIGEDITGINLASEEFIVGQAINRKDDIHKVSPQDDGAFYTLDSIIGSDPTIINLKKQIRLAAANQSNVLIYGETGTGKEMIAQAIHSLRKEENTPFIAQNCAAIPESLLEGILFGTVKGAFTGAETRPGLFELAHGGILFLDEINSMQMNLQAKILRVIQEGKIRRIGGHEEIAVDFKLIASTNVHPKTLIETGEMRRDLYYRLNVFYLELPPLSARKNDIPLLVQSFIKEYSERLDKKVVAVDQKTMDFFMNYPWPGNIRELKNVIERLVAISTDMLIRFEDTDLNASMSIVKTEAPGQTLQVSGDRVRLKEAVRALEINLIKDALIKTQGNISKASRDLDLPQQTLSNKIKRYELGHFIDQLK